MKRWSIFIIIVFLFVTAFASKPGQDPYLDCLLKNRVKCVTSGTDGVNGTLDKACMDKVTHDCQCKNWLPSNLKALHISCP